MKLFFDTSVLVAAAIEAHSAHEPSRVLVLRPGSRATAAHCLAETYNTLTRLNGLYRLSAAEALQAVQSLEERMDVVALNALDYSRALRRAAALGLAGPIVYDFLIAAAAERAAAGRLYTWNTRHFAPFAPSLRVSITTPPSA